MGSDVLCSEVPCPGEGVQCIMGNGYIEPLPLVNRQTRLTKIITFPQLPWRVIIKADNEVVMYKIQHLLTSNKTWLHDGRLRAEYSIY